MIIIIRGNNSFAQTQSFGKKIIKGKQNDYFIKQNDFYYKQE